MNKILAVFVFFAIIEINFGKRAKRRETSLRKVLNISGFFSSQPQLSQAQ